MGRKSHLFGECGLRRSVVAVTAVVAALACAGAAGASLRGAIDRALSVSHVPRSSTGVLVVNLRTGTQRYALNAGRAFRPASNEKLVVALAALDRLGPGFAVPTRVLGDGALDGSVWRGRLVLKGFGDPTLSRRRLNRLAVRIEAKGITRVTGRIVGDESYFDTRRTAPGWKPSYYKEESPPLSALVVDRARVRGYVVSDPALWAARFFRRALVAAGVRVDRKAIKGTAAAGASLLAQTSSHPLGRLVRRMNKRSDNFVAEMLVKELGARLRGSGTTRAGLRVARNVLRGRGVPLAGVALYDGSGLSEWDRLTARAVAALSISAWSDPELHNVFVGSLPIAGVDGTLEDRMERDPAFRDVRAKTGTTDRSSALSGYVGRKFVFAILMNGSPVPFWYAQRAQDRVGQALARRL
jgi:D-alanyl-D-alanine carboxypeptidase/D-alanyl-D-alanine-endopeptidase (penicillin-binding protein 4)